MTHPMLTAQRIAALANANRSNIELSARIENAGIHYVNRVRSKDKDLSLPKWLDAMLAQASANASEEAR